MFSLKSLLEHNNLSNKFNDKQTRLFDYLLSRSTTNNNKTYAQYSNQACYLTMHVDNASIRKIRNIDLIEFHCDDLCWKFSFDKTSLVEDDITDIQTLKMMARYVECVDDDVAVEVKPSINNRVKVTILGKFN